MDLTALLVYIALALITIQCVLIGVLWMRGGGSSRVEDYSPHDGSDTVAIEIQALKMEIQGLKSGGSAADGPRSPTAQNSGSDFKLPPEQRNTLQQHAGSAEGRPQFVPAPAMNQFQPDFEMPAMVLHAPTYETMSVTELRDLLVERDLGDLIENVKVISPLGASPVRSTCCCGTVCRMPLLCFSVWSLLPRLANDSHRRTRRRRTR